MYPDPNPAFCLTTGSFYLSVRKWSDLSCERPLIRCFRSIRVVDIISTGAGGAYVSFGNGYCFAKVVVNVLFRSRLDQLSSNPEATSIALRVIELMTLPRSVRLAFPASKQLTCALTVEKAEIALFC